MGNEGSKKLEKEQKKVHLEESNRQRILDQRAAGAFNYFSKGLPTISCRNFTEAFGEDFGSDLWKYLSDGASEKSELDVAKFSHHISSLIGTSTDCYLQVLLPAEHILKICSESAGVYACDGDQQFLLNIVHDMGNAGSSVADLSQWKHQKCPRLCNAAQARVMEAFGLGATNSVDFSSDVLSPFQMWFLQCSLPDIYFPQSKPEEGDNSSHHWTPLYSSLEQGISVTRFEANVFDYRGPTVAVFRLKDNSLYVLAVDQEWRNSGSTFGSTNTVFFELLPSFRRIEKSGSVYCNFKLRNFPLKLSFDRFFSVDKEMNNVIAVEVFGCSGATTLQEQQKLKEWQKRQVEKNKKVPLPGNWDDNPDKFLLELGGVYSTADRREVFRREEE